VRVPFRPAALLHPQPHTPGPARLAGPGIPCAGGVPCHTRAPVGLRTPRIPARILPIRPRLPANAGRAKNRFVRGITPSGSRNRLTDHNARPELTICVNF
jgi:hypothetical protein